MLSAAMLISALSAQAAVNIQHWQTSSGAEVYFVENHALPIVDLSVNFAAGSARDTAEKSGLAGITRYMMTLGAAGMSDEVIGTPGRHEIEAIALETLPVGGVLLEEIGDAVFDPVRHEVPVQRLGVVICAIDEISEKPRSAPLLHCVRRRGALSQLPDLHGESVLRQRTSHGGVDQGRVDR